MPNLNFILQEIDKFSATYILALLILTAIVIFFLLASLIFSVKTWRWQRRILGKSKREDLKEILSEHLQRVGLVQVRINDLDKEIRGLKDEGRLHVQKLGVVRFNPFSDTGSDQSFAIALLDANDSGIVFSTLHGRDRTRIYAKPVVNSRPGDYEFSDEEKEAIRKAQELK